MALKSYNFDLKKLIVWMLPSFYRKPKWVAWIYALLAKVRAIHTEFVAFIAIKKDEIKWNGQTIVLEQFLILKYGSGIYITSVTNEVFPFYVYEVNNVLNPFVYPINNVLNPMANEVNSYNLDGVNFIVHVPAIITFNTDEMTALINKYRLFGTTFSIVTF